VSEAPSENAFRQFIKGISQRDLAQLRAATDPEIEFTSYFAGVDAKTFSSRQR
jgi:hypothetical protein